MEYKYLNHWLNYYLLLFRQPEYYCILKLQYMNHETNEFKITNITNFIPGNKCPRIIIHIYVLVLYIQMH